MTFTLARPRVRVGRTGQRVRVNAPIVSPPASQSNVFNLTSRFGDYGRLSLRNGDLFFAYSGYGTPPFEFEAQVTGRGDVTEGQFLWAADRKIVLIYAASDGITGGYSTDDGQTFAGGGFNPGSHCACAAGPDGTMAFAVSQLGGMTVGLQPPGDPDYPLLFPVGNTVVDAGLLPISFEDDGFRVCFDSRGWLWMHARILGSGQTDLLFSTDQEQTPGVMTWAPTSGAVPGITSGAHPGICPTTDGGLVAWAYVAGALKVTRRGPGDVDWSAPVNAKDAASVDLAVADAASSYAHAYEGPSRLILSTTIGGEATPSDWGSPDLGLTAKRF
jgi:hypothetical protein